MTERTGINWGLACFGVLALAGLLAGCTAGGAAKLKPPAGYYLAAPATPQGRAQACPDMPQPYTGKLVFPSKYTGSDRARDRLNVQAAQRYIELTEQIRQLENGVNRQVARYLENGQAADVACALEWLQAWADADALLSKEYNHTGKSVRKWALGSVAGAYLRLKFSRSQPLAGHARAAAQIEDWLARLADQVVVDWRSQPLQRRNNHQYWAAWSVMASAVILDRQDLFDWAVQELRDGLQHVDAEGYLPLELQRQTRALAYHNYSMGPLMMLAAFAQTNGVDLRKHNDHALQRLAQRLEAGLREPQLFQQKTGHPQVLDDLQQNGRFAWLEPYCALFACSAQTQAWRLSLQPMSTYRLGGNITQLFTGQLP